MIAPASTVVVTAAEVFNETDPMHCVARIVRKGGGRYMVTDALGQGAQMVDTYADAVGLADKIGRERGPLDAGSTTPDYPRLDGITWTRSEHGP